MGCVLNKTTLVDVSNQLRENGENVVFTHGAFDMFHVGHATFLKESKKRGDFMIVGVESDKRMGLYAGKNRPIIPFEDRMGLVSDLSYVDFVMPIVRGPMNKHFYISLYEKLNPKVVTFGKNFGHQEQMKTRRYKVGGIKYKKIKHTFSDVRSTTELLKQLQGQE